MFFMLYPEHYEQANQLDRLVAQLLISWEKFTILASIIDGCLTQHIDIDSSDSHGDNYAMYRLRSWQNTGGDIRYLLGACSLRHPKSLWHFIPFIILLGTIVPLITVVHIRASSAGDTCHEWDTISECVPANPPYRSDPTDCHLSNHIQSNEACSYLCVYFTVYLYRFKFSELIHCISRHCQRQVWWLKFEGYSMSIEDIIWKYILYTSCFSYSSHIIARQFLDV